ncbi:MAG: ACP S-malonyltransferase [Lachnospiraceae bacterium]|nr:ACP S-malonyltransferase [Lachnospiraceae bacterium]
MGKTAFLFPGQGAQKAGMGKDFYETYGISRKIFDDASEWLGLDMAKLCFEENDLLDQTQYTQAALVTTCLAMEKVLEAEGLRPDVAAGLSLGEYCAIEVAGGMSVKDAITAVRTRGILMEQAVPAGQGGMAAVLGLSPETVNRELGFAGNPERQIAGVTVANYNCPGQIVITGMANRLPEATERLKAAGAKRVVPLNVSGPFHSPMLIPAGEKLEEVLRNVDIQPLSIPYVANATAEYVTDENKIRDLLKIQISSSVRWQQSVEAMIADGVDTFVEIGPGRTLAGFMKKIDSSKTVYNVQTVADVVKVADLKKIG